jgi:hypothetical protein
MFGAFGANRGNYGQPAFHSFLPNKSTQIPANSLNNVQQPDYPLLFDQYTGDPLKMMAEIVWQVGIMDKSEFLLTDILPVQQVDKITVDMNWMFFEPKLMDTNPEWSQAKLVSFGRRQKRKRLVRRGLQMEMEQGFASEEFGRETFNRYIEAIVMSQRDTLCVDIMLALQNAPLDTEELWKKDPRWKGRSSADALADEIFFYGIIQKVARPFEAMDSKIRSNMAFVNGEYDTLIVPARVTGYVKAAKDKYLDYYTAGASGPTLSKTNPDNADNRGLYPGISGDLIIPLKPSYEQSDLTGGHSLMTSPMSVGEYYRCFSHIDFTNPHWTPDNQAIEIYDETDSTRKKISLLEIVQHANLFDATGELIPINKLEYLEGDLKIDPERGIYDMFTTAAGESTRLFGNIDHRFLHPRDVVDWAKKVVTHMHHETGVDGATFTDFETKLNAKLQDKNANVSATELNTLSLAFVGYIANCFPRNAYLHKKAKRNNPKGRLQDEITSAGQTLLRNFFASNLPSVFRTVGSDEGSSDSARQALLSKIFTGLGSSEQVSDERAIAASHLWCSLKIAGRADDVSPDLSVSQMDAARRALKLSSEQKREAESLHLRSVEVLRSSGGSSRDGWEIDRDTIASEAMARAVYESWKRDPASPPAELPGNPESPEVPASLEVLENYFGSRASLRWPAAGGNVNALTPHLRGLINDHFALGRLSEEHGSSAYDVFQSKLQIQGSQHLNAYMSFMQDETAKAQNEGLINPRNRSPTAFRDIDETAIQDLLDLSESTMNTSWKAVQTMSSGAARFLSLLFLTTEVHEETIERWANCGLPLPFQGVIVRPNITHFVSSAIACKRGRANLGYMAIGKGNFTYGSDPGPQSLMGHFTFYSGAIIEKPFNVADIPAITVDQYIGGKGVRWIDVRREIRFESAPEESMYGFIVPLRSEMPFVMSITGSTFDLPRMQELQLREEPYFPQALRFRRTTGTYKMLEDMSANEQTVPNPRNFICLPGKYWFRAENEFNNVFEGKGHFWNTDGPDAKAIRSGGLIQYNTDAGGNNRY